MNHNIEVINENLWAVRFSLIPFIKEIEYVSDEIIPAYQEPCRMTNAALLILNKDNKGYELLKDIMTKVMKKSDRQLKKELNLNMVLKKKDIFKTLYSFALRTEMERRAKKKGGK